MKMAPNGSASAVMHPHVVTEAPPSDETKNNLRSTTRQTSTTAVSTKTSSFAWWNVLRLLCLDIPLLILFMTLVLSFICLKIYTGPIATYIHSFRRNGATDSMGYMPELDDQVTYYNRQCTAEDITTGNANDLLLNGNMTRDEAAHTMMTHGAVLIPSLLSQDTAAKLRDYLEGRHEVFKAGKLPFQENFWSEISRLALGLGADDDPIVAQALSEVGSNAILKTVLEGIVGEDPAIVEISTLSAMHGAPEQGIHTDSDFWGSSLMYSRSFLHSYTLFMALQDTTSKMGATTICPGTHHCANEDMDDICTGGVNPFNGKPGPAFEVSSNGMTGLDVGVLKRGDGMMFNQNVWHRGARNLDPDFPINRVMFIVTFASRQARDKGDTRQQGLGTYYYQRWNMWGHVFSDMKDALKGSMSQPWGALSGLGLYKPNNKKWGIPWVEQFARCIANRQDFYTDYELADFIDFLDERQFPEFLRGKSPMWEPFIQQTLQNIVSFLKRIYKIALAVYLGLHVLVFLAFQPSSKDKSKTMEPYTHNFFKRLLLRHVVIALVGYGIWLLVVHKSYLGQRIRSGEIFRIAFPEDVPFLDTGLTTLPERMDVLVGSRFDADFLAVYNHALDYHPGNKRFDAFASELTEIPEALVEEGTKSIVNWVREKESGFSPRFLRQQVVKGAWAIMTEEESLEFTRRFLLTKRSLITAKLAAHLRNVLADSRFGLFRETAMARVFTQQFVEGWERIIFGHTPFTSSKSGTSRPLSFMKPRAIAQSIKMPDISLKRKPNSLLRNNTRVATGVTVSDRVYVQDEDTGRFHPATVTHIEDNEEWCTVTYTTGGYDRVMASSLRIYRPMKEGDKVMVDADGEWSPAVIYRATPFGTYDIRYDEGNEYEYSLVPESMYLTDMESVELELPDDSEDDGIKLFYVGQPVEVYFGMEDRWYSGYVARVNADNSYTVDFEDGSTEVRIPFDAIRALPLARKIDYDDDDDDDDEEEEEPEFHDAIDYLDGDEEDEVPVNLIRSI